MKTPDLSWANGSQDGAELITASATLGVPHPPGYPTYTIIGKLFSLLPLGTVAFRFNLLSAVCTAAAVGLVVMAITTIHPRVRPLAAISTDSLVLRSSIGTGGLILPRTSSAVFLAAPVA